MQRDLAQFSRARLELENAHGAVLLSYPPDGSIAHSQHGRRCEPSCLGVRAVFLVEVKSTLPEIACHNVRGVWTNTNKFP